MQLRPYQTAALDATFQYWNQGGDNPLVVMATGTGKSLVQASLGQQLISQYSGLRIVSITHVQELIEQNYKELLGIWPFAPAGMYSAGLGQRAIQSQFLFGGIQSLHRRVAELGHVDLLIVDEAHLIPRNADTMYGRFITELLQINPDMRVLGLTATPYRTDSGRLDEGDARLFDRVVYEYDIADGIRDGYLSRLVSKGTDTRFNLEGVGRRGGDFIPGALQAACDKDETTRAAVAEIVAAGRDRKTWLLFCAGVQHALHVRDEVRRYGIRCETIHGETPKGERRAILKAFDNGEIQAVTNNAVLTVGTNVKRVDLIAGLRPTESTGLYVQMAGRGTRLFPGKENCLYLDFAGNVYRHGPVDDVQPRKPGKGDGEAPVKECPHCRTLVPISCRECPECGQPFEIIDKPKHAATADVLPILKVDASTPQRFPIKTRKFSKHINKEGSESVRVDLFSGFVNYPMWLSFRMKGMVHKFWRDHDGGTPYPEDVDEFLARQGELKPSQWFLGRKSKHNKKYTDILSVIPQREEESLNAAA